MKQVSILVAIIMIHSGFSVLAASTVNSNVDFNKEIDMVTQEQFVTHMETLSKTRVTEAAVDFENRYRKPTPSKSLTFFPLRLRSKAAPKKTKVAESTMSTPNPRANLIQLYREQTL